MPRAENKRLRFFATEREQNLILSLRQFAGIEEVKQAVSNGILCQLEQLERKKSFMKQEKQELSEEYKNICMAIAPLELVYLNWRELMRELTGEK